MLVVTSHADRGVACFPSDIAAKPLTVYDS